MADTTRPAPGSDGLYLALLWLIGVQLRLTILAVPPVLPLIHRDLALSEKAIGVLSSGPVLLLALAAVPGSLMVARLGARRGCILGLAIVAAAGAARGLGPSAPLLFVMTLAMGVGVALMQPTLPSLVSEWFPTRTGFATAIYGNGLLIGEAVPAALTIPFVLPWVGGSWEWSFTVWSLPVAATLLLLAVATPHRERARAPQDYHWWPDWRGALPVGMLLGGTAGMYFLCNAFLPDYLHAVGRPDLVSASLGALNIAQVPASAVTLAFSRQLVGNRAILIASPLAAAAGIVTVIWLPELVVAAAGLIGFCCGVQLIASLALPPLLATTDDVHRLSAGTFAIGYLIGFATSPIGGAIWDATGVPATAFIAGGLAAALVIGASQMLRIAPAGSAPRR